MSVNLDNELIKKARIYCVAQSRSLTKQIEYWAKMGRIAEENPDLSFNAIKGILLGFEDIKNGNSEEYNPDLL